MKHLDELPEIASEALGGLTAGQNLKYRIERAAREGSAPARRRAPRYLPALCCALALVVGAVFAVPALTRNGADNDAGVLTVSQRAGSATDAPMARALDLPAGSITLTAGSGAPDYRSIWNGQSNDFALIGVSGRYYRLLDNPSSVGDALLGGELGTVAEYTTEPALSGTDVILSNTAVQGTTVYEISGMGGTLVAAQVDGVNRVFQRVSFNGNAVKGSEGLADTLQVKGHVLGLELSGVGTIMDSAAAETLVATLMDNATFESSGSIQGKQSLLIQLDNGLTVQLAVKDDRFGACGTWSCPEFIDAFAAACK